ncbi:MAG: hypothetical protein AAFS04_04440 [Cyanobacteria bacterium J06631_9]
MVKASSQIEKELGLLQQRTEDMDAVLDPLYDGYLKALSAAGTRQLMSAAFHLCTQAYPDKFLKLSWQQRNELQTSIQQLSSQIYAQFCEQRAQTKVMSRRPQRNSGLAFLQRLLEARASGAIIHAAGGSGDELREKLAAIAQADPRLGESSDKRSRRTNNGFVEDWENEVPLAEDPEADRRDGFIPLGEEAAFDGALGADNNPDSSDESDQKSGESNADSFEGIDFEKIDFSDVSALSRAQPNLSSSEKITSEGSESLPDASDNGPDFETSGLETSDFETSDFSEADTLDLDEETLSDEQPLSLSDEEDLLSALEGLARSTAEDEEDSNEAEKPLTPLHLVKQQVLMEKAIHDVFKAISEEVNELLQKAKVMPSFPKALMAAATDSHGLGDPVNAVPNVVKVSVRVMHGEANLELDDDELDSNDRDDLRANDRDDRASEHRRRRSGGRNDARNDDRNNGRMERYEEGRGRMRDRNKHRPSRNRRQMPSFMPHEMIEIDAFPELAVINLQLSEIEFSDPTVSVWRARLRKELSHLKKLGVRYQKTQKSLETAKAEDAWRSSWTNVEES